MKNLFILGSSFLVSQLSFAQCTFDGFKTLVPGETISLTTHIKAKCEQCYTWSSSDESILKIEENSYGKVAITGKKPGKITISVVADSDQGKQQCETVIEVLASKQDMLEKGCGIAIDDFKEVKVNESVISFFPNVNSNEYNYKWTVTYSDGEVADSEDKIPQFNLSESRFIASVKLKVGRKSLPCHITMLKKYDQNFWNLSKNKVEQKTYSQGSYNDSLNLKDKKTLN